jgi:F0F1-type ATP synthase assembly protein I
LTLDKANAEIARCGSEISERERERQREISEREHERLREINIASAKLLSKLIAGILAGIISVALTIRFRTKIFAWLYNLFVGCLALRLRFSRSRKRFLDNAIKEAENRLG